MSINLDFSTVRSFKTNRNPTSEDYLITIQDGSSIVPEVGNFWKNEPEGRLWQCDGITPGVSSVWSEKPALSQGTFTPVLQFGGGSTGITYSGSGQTGIYTRIGSLVYINIFLQLTNKGSSTGNAIVTGLPFAARAAISPKGVDITKVFTGVSDGFSEMKGRINAGESQVRLVETSNAVGTGLQNVTDQLFANNSIIQIDGFYFI